MWAYLIRGIERGRGGDFFHSFMVGVYSSWMGWAGVINISRFVGDGEEVGGREVIHRDAGTKRSLCLGENLKQGMGFENRMGIF